MVLALNYMRRTKTAAPDVAAKARRYIAKGYNRLLTFESKEQPGGFALWPRGKPAVFLTAYGLMQFVDMAAVHPVAPELIARIKAFLRAQQQEDGSFTQGNLVHRWGSWQETPYFMTAYVAWALGRAGEDTSKALAYLRKHGHEVDDPYGIALGGLAFAAADPRSGDTRAAVARLAAMGTKDGETLSWRPAGETFVGGRGKTGRIETTAMACLLFQQTGLAETQARRAMDALVASRRGDGRFGSTHSTALALRALIEGAGNKPLPATGVAVLRSGKVLTEAAVPEGSTEPVRIELGRMDPSTLDFRLTSAGRMRGTLSRTTYEPWDDTKVPQGPLRIAVAWHGGPLDVHGEYVATVTIKNTGKAKAKVVTAEVGLPPGVTVKPKQVTGPGLDEAEIGPRALVLYLDTLAPGEERTFQVPFRVRHAFDVRTAPTRVYEYYAEHEATVLPPIRLRTR